MNIIELNNKKKKKKIYLGIEILRMILSFLIVVVHFYNKNYAKNSMLKFPFQNLCFYIPTFFVISFYFSNNSFTNRNILKINQRFKRILIPYIIWPILFWIRNNIYNYYYGIKFKNKFKNLYYQLLIGCPFYRIFWFQFNLIIISILFLIIIFSFKKKYLLILQLLGFIAYNFNYSKCRHNFFLNYNYKIVCHSIKPITSNLVYSIIGFILFSINILNKLHSYRIKVLFAIIFLIYLIKKYKYIFYFYPFFNRINIVLVSIGLFCFFALIPIDRIQNEKIIFILKLMTSNTGGIYYLHPEIRNNYLKNYLIIVKYKTFRGCILIYIITYFVCFIGSKTMRKTNLKYLFI